MSASKRNGNGSSRDVGRDGESLRLSVTGAILGDRVEDLLGHDHTLRRSDLDKRHHTEQTGRNRDGDGGRESVEERPIRRKDVPDRILYATAASAQSESIKPSPFVLRSTDSPPNQPTVHRESNSRKSSDETLLTVGHKAAAVSDFPLNKSSEAVSSGGGREVSGSRDGLRQSSNSELDRRSVESNKDGENVSVSVEGSDEISEIDRRILALQSYLDNAR